MFARKQPFHARRVAGMRAMRARIKAQGRGEMSLADFGRGSGKMLALTRIFNLWFRWEQWWYKHVMEQHLMEHNWASWEQGT